MRASRAPLATLKSFGNKEMSWRSAKSRILFAPSPIPTRILRAKCERLLSLLGAAFPRSAERGSIEAVWQTKIVLVDAEVSTFG